MLEGFLSFFQAAQCIPVGKEYDIPEANVVTYTPDQLGHSNHSLGGGVEGVQLRPYRTLLSPSSSVTVTHHMKSALLQVTHAFFSNLVFAFAVLQLQRSCRHPDTHPRTATDADRERLKRKTPEISPSPLSPRVPTLDS